MTPLILLALWSCVAGVSSRWLLGRMPRSPSAEQCSQLTAPWTGTQLAAAAADWSRMYRLRVAPMAEEGAQRPVFPQQPLFRFIRRVYRCCRLRRHCGAVKGLQGRGAADSAVEFVLSEDVWSAPILRAEVHLDISNPHQLNIQPLLPWLEKRHIPTRYSVWRNDGVLEVRVDLLFLFQALRGKRRGSSVMEIWRLGGLHTIQASKARPTEMQGGDRKVARPLQVPVELGLALHCSTVELNTPLPCESHGVRLLHTPFITLSYG